MNRERAFGFGGAVMVVADVFLGLSLILDLLTIDLVTEGSLAASILAANLIVVVAFIITLQNKLQWWASAGAAVLATMDAVAFLAIFWATSGLRPAAVVSITTTVLFANAAITIVMLLLAVVPQEQQVQETGG